MYLMLTVEPGRIRAKVPSTERDACKSKQVGGEGYGLDTDNVYYSSTTKQLSFLTLNNMGVHFKVLAERALLLNR